MTGRCVWKHGGADEYPAVIRFALDNEDWGGNNTISAHFWSQASPSLRRSGVSGDTLDSPHERNPVKSVPRGPRTTQTDLAANMHVIHAGLT